MHFSQIRWLEKSKIIFPDGLGTLGLYDFVQNTEQFYILTR